MGIATASALSSGTAVRLFLQPVEGAAWWRLLRRTDSNFSGPADPNAFLVVDQSGFLGATDYCGLTNGTPYFYQLYSTPDGTVAALAADGPVVTCTPAAGYQDAAPDPQEVLRDRIIAGLAVEVAMGNLTPAKSAQPPGIIATYTAPFMNPDSVSFPCVTVHVDDTGPSDRFIGEGMAGDFTDLSGNAVESEGWLASFNINVVGTTLNPDERILMRKALRRIIQANLPVFDAAGMTQITFSQADTEQFVENAAPMFMTAGRFSCVAPAGLTDAAPPLASISLTFNTGTDQING